MGSESTASVINISGLMNNVISRRLTVDFGRGASVGVNERSDSELKILMNFPRILKKDSVRSLTSTLAGINIAYWQMVSVKTIKF